jgi:hypothetical protein
MENRISGALATSEHPLSLEVEADTIDRLRRLMRYYSNGEGPSLEDVARVCLKLGAELYLGEIDNSRLRRFKAQARFMTAIVDGNLIKRPGPTPKRRPQLPKKDLIAASSGDSQ